VSTQRGHLLRPPHAHRHQIRLHLI
jgi:hypothetical protein